jgi:hypothetical protein
MRMQKGHQPLLRTDAALSIAPESSAIRKLSRIRPGKSALQRESGNKGQITGLRVLRPGASAVTISRLSVPDPGFVPVGGDPLTIAEAASTHVGGDVDVALLSSCLGCLTFEDTMIGFR